MGGCLGTAVLCMRLSPDLCDGPCYGSHHRLSEPCRSDARDFRILQMTFTPVGFMRAIFSGLLKCQEPDHFHWRAPLRQRFEYQAPVAVAYVAATL